MQSTRTSISVPPLRPARPPGERPLVHVRDAFHDPSALRAEFERRLGHDLFRVTPERFVWDYWHVPGRYTYLRTDARTFFPASTLVPFVRELRRWAFEELGMGDLNSLWLSYYVEGCRQELHHDTGLGEWAFVYSLTDWTQRAFVGGETMIADVDARAAWRWDETIASPAHTHFDAIDAELGRLVVFDARVPHAVRKVQGTHDPLGSRVVLHGWLKPAGTVSDGALDAEAIERGLEPAFAAIEAALERRSGISGLLCARLFVDADGSVRELRTLTDGLVQSEREGDSPTALRDELLASLRETRFPRAEGKTRITLPLEIGG